MIDLPWLVVTATQRTLVYVRGCLWHGSVHFTHASRMYSIYKRSPWRSSKRLSTQMATGTSGASSIARAAPLQALETRAAGAKDEPLPTDTDDVYARLDIATWGSIATSARAAMVPNVRMLAGHRSSVLAEKKHVLADEKWKRLHCVAFPLANNTPQNMRPFALDISCENEQAIAQITKQLLVMARSNRLDVVAAVRMSGVASTAIINALVEHCGRTLRMVDLSAVTHMNQVAMLMVLNLPQIHDLSVCVGSLSGVVAKELPSPDAFVRMISAVPQSTLIHLSIYGNVSPDVAWDPARFLPHLRTYALYCTSALPTTIPMQWSVQREIRFTSARTPPWPMGYGMEAENNMRPDLGQVHPGSQYETTVPV